MQNQSKREITFDTQFKTALSNKVCMYVFTLIQNQYRRRKRVVTKAVLSKKQLVTT